MRSQNKVTKNNGFIFSVFQNDKPFSVNEVNHNVIMESLKDSKIPFKVVEGRYTNEKGNTMSELSFYVDSILEDTKNIEEKVKTLCSQHNQESYLSLSSDRKVDLKFSNGKCIKLGTLVSVNKEVAQLADAFTFDPSTESYFIVK